jgi:long-chain acyl-CoA synthetase
MLKLPGAERAAFGTSSLRLVIHAAAPISVEVEERMIEWFGPILTEFCAGSEGDELPAGETGTVWFSGTKRFTYHNDPAKTASAYNGKSGTGAPDGSRVPVTEWRFRFCMLVAEWEFRFQEGL